MNEQATEVVREMTFGPDAITLAVKGWPVFPCQLVDETGTVVPLEEATPEMKLKKVPVGTLVERGFKEATTNPKRIALWQRVAPDALIGVAMPPNTVALDVDELDRFTEAGLELPEAPTQQTLRGGYHKFFKTDGRRVRQTVKEIPGADTRVGGRGYVVAWEPDAFPEVGDLPDAPEWLYSDGSDDPRTDERDPGAPLSIRRVRRTVEVATFKVGERDNALARFAGMMRREGAGPDAIYAAMKAMLENGQIESPREDPITDKDLKRIAGSIGTKESAEVNKQRRPPPKRFFANDILTQDFGTLKYFIDELLPEGLGIVAGPPKVGKSWLVLQTAIAACTAGSLLDRAVEEAVPVLYYALEDGPRRAQDRIKTLVGAQSLDLGWLEFRFDAPRLDEGLEEEIDGWLKDNGGGVIILDVFARIRPPSRGKGSAYDEDYSILKPLHEIVKRHRESGRVCSVVVVTHLRKQGSEDPFAMVQGTTGVTGSADWTWIVKRDRMSPKGTIQVGGRDIRNEPLVEAVFDGAWTAIGTTVRTGSPQRDRIRDYLLTEGDSTTAQITSGLNATRLPNEIEQTTNGVNEKLNALQVAGLVEQTATYVKGKGGGYVWHALTEDEIEAQRSATKTAARAATAAAATEDPRVIPIHRVSRAGAPAGGRAPAPARAAPTPHAPQAPHPDLEPVEGVEGVEGQIARRRARGHAPAYTRMEMSDMSPGEDDEDDEGGKPGKGSLGEAHDTRDNETDIAGGRRRNQPRNRERDLQ